MKALGIAENLHLAEMTAALDELLADAALARVLRVATVAPNYRRSKQKNKNTYDLSGSPTDPRARELAMIEAATGSTALMSMPL